MKIEPKVENPAESECEHAVSATFFLGCLNFKTDRDCALFHNNLPQYDCTNFGFFGFAQTKLGILDVIRLQAAEKTVAFVA